MRINVVGLDVGVRAVPQQVKASGPGQGLRPLRDPDAAEEDVAY
ncbi:hypothetical protein [Streptomyces sp. NPDC058695]